MMTEPSGDRAANAFDELERSTYAALETYSNVHRGSGHHSLASTRLYEQARAIVLDHLNLSHRTHAVIFSTLRRARALQAQLAAGSYATVSSRDLGLPLGVTALAVGRRALKGLHAETGGGTARLVALDWVVWAAAPDRFEAGTPAIINVIAFAKALQLTRLYGLDAFRTAAAEPLSAGRIVREDELAGESGSALLEMLRGTLIGRDVRVPTTQGMHPYVNLDNGASTPTFEPVWSAVRQTWRQTADVQQAIPGEVRSVCADLLGAPSSEYDVIFTSNTTEAINLVAESLAIGREGGSEPVVVNTLLEHNSNELPWRSIPGGALIHVPIDGDGFVDLNELDAVMREHNQDGRHGAKRVVLVAVSGASNVLGVYNDLGEISRIVHAYGARLLVDAAQLVAHRAVSMQRSGIDYLAFSAHKAYAPFGTGVLVARKGLLNFSEAQMQLVRSSGEENTIGIAALGKALVLLQRIGLDVIQEREQVLTTRALHELSRVPGVKLYGIADPASPAFKHKGGVIPFDVKDTISHSVARQLAQRGGVGVRSGCHCAHLTVKRMLDVPPWAQELQRAIVTALPRVELPGVARVSLGIENTAEDVDTLVRVLREIAEQPRGGGGTSARGIKRRMEEYAVAAARKVYAAPA